MNIERKIREFADRAAVYDVRRRQIETRSMELRTLSQLPNLTRAETSRLVTMLTKHSTLQDELWAEGDQLIRDEKEFLRRHG